jgi:tetratricopeptide (TPR) repeat protein
VKPPARVASAQSSPRRRAVRRAALALLLVVTSAVAPHPAAHADPQAEARQSYEAARRAYNLGQWEDAIAGFEKAYKLSGETILLFDRAQALRQANRLPEALAGYRAYLREDPNAANRESVDARIRELEARATHAPAPEKPRASDVFDPFTAAGRSSPAAVIAAAPAKKSSAATIDHPGSGWLRWAGLTTTVALAGGAVAAGLVTNSRYDDLKKGCGRAAAGCSDDQIQGVRSRARLTNILWVGTALAAAGTGAAFWFDARGAGVELSLRY